MRKNKTVWLSLLTMLLWGSLFPMVKLGLIAAEQMKKNGDCIAEGNLGMRSPLSYAEEELQVLNVIRSMYPKASDKVTELFIKASVRARSTEPLSRP